MKIRKTQLAWSSLTRRYGVSVRALELAGGYGGMLDLFGARLRTFLSPHGYVIACGGQILSAVQDRDNLDLPFLIFGIGGYEPGDDIAPAVLEGVDHSIITWKAPLLPEDGGFAMLYQSVRDLIAEWPEIKAAA